MNFISVQLIYPHESLYELLYFILNVSHHADTKLKMKYKKIMTQLSHLGCGSPHTARKLLKRTVLYVLS